MIPAIVLSVFALIFIVVFIVCIHYKRKNYKSEEYHKFFWNKEHLKPLIVNKNVRNRILFTIGALILFRLGTLVTIPNIDTAGLIKAVGDNPLISMMNLLGGGGLEQFSIFALGIGPYITASIIIQLLSMDVIPHLTELAKQGQTGKLVLNKYTRWLTVIFSIVQSVSMVYGFSTMYPNLFKNGFALSSVVFITLVFTAGSMFLVWLGDQIKKKGIGNGVSLLIATGIIARFPQQYHSMYDSLVGGELTPDHGTALFFGLLGMMVVMVIFIGVVNTTEYRIPVQYTSSSMELNENSESNYLPFKFNSASVIPVIFASSLMMTPLQLINFFIKKRAEWYTTLSQWLGFHTWYSLVVYGLLIIFFGYFYTMLQINPEELSENLAKSGAYIPKVRPGKATEKFITKLLKKLTTVGTIALLAVSLLPYVMPLLFDGVPASLPVGGTGLIIVVGVIIETYRQLKGVIIQESYTM